MPSHTDEERKKNSERIQEQRKENAERFANISEQDITQAKAKEILKDGEVKGEPLSTKQKKLFGAVAGGEEPKQ